MLLFFFPEMMSATGNERSCYYNSFHGNCLFSVLQLCMLNQILGVGLKFLMLKALHF